MSSPADSAQPRSPETILVVEDEILIRMPIAEYLRDCGYRVIEATSADEAIVILQQAEIRIDVVFSDIEMPGSIDGFGLSQWVRQNRADLAVILAGTAARAANAAGELCEEGPALAKPYEPQAVLERIRQLLGAQTKR